MADYIEIKDAGGVTRKVSVDEVSSQFVQRLKMQFGADGSASDVSSDNPLPVSDAGALEQLEALASALGGSLSVEDPAALSVLEGILSALGSTIKVGDGSGLLTVELGAALPAGTNNIGQVDPRGNVAHDAADSGNPVKVGGRAVTALPTAVSANDRVDAIHDKFGRRLTSTSPLDQRFKGNLNRTNNTAAQIVAAPGASVALVITNVKVINGHATVGTKVELIEGESTQLDVGYAGPLGGGWVMENKDGLYPPLAANAKLQAKCVTTGADVDIFVSGYKIPA